ERILECGGNRLRGGGPGGVGGAPRPPPPARIPHGLGQLFPEKRGPLRFWPEPRPDFAGAGVSRGGAVAPISPPRGRAAAQGERGQVRTRAPGRYKLGPTGKQTEEGDSRTLLHHQAEPL